MMFKKTLRLKTIMLGVVGLITTGMVLVATTPEMVSAQTSTVLTKTPETAQSAAVLAILVRDSIGNPLEGLNCEVLSYGWGLQINEAYAVIARGETDKNGVVAFDVSRWPNAGYRFKFSATDHLKPAGTYILPDSDNQYRGYPGAVVGGRAELQKFVLSGSDSVFYNDISREGQLPEYQRDPVAGMLQPRVSVMDGQDYLATAIAATSTAEARGEPTPTMPSPPSPSPRPGEIQPALTVTPGSALTAAAAAAAKPTSISPVTSTTTKPPTASGQVTQNNQAVTSSSASPGTTSVVVALANQSPAVNGSVAGLTPRGLSTTQATGQATTSSLTNQESSGTRPTGTGSNLFVSSLLAIFGIACLVLFWKFRFSIYPLFGIEASPRKKGKAKVKAKARIRVNQVKPNPGSVVNEASAIRPSGGEELQDPGNQTEINPEEAE